MHEGKRSRSVVNAISLLSFFFLFSFNGKSPKQLRLTCRFSAMCFWHVAQRCATRHLVWHHKSKWKRGTKYKHTKMLFLDMRETTSRKVPVEVRPLVHKNVSLWMASVQVARRVERSWSRQISHSDEDVPPKTHNNRLIHCHYIDISCYKDQLLYQADGSTKTHSVLPRDRDILEWYIDRVTPSSSPLSLFYAHLILHH